MGTISDIRVIDARYNGILSFTDILNDPLVRSNLEILYVPQVDVREAIFLKKDELITVSNSSPVKVKFLYLSGSGKLNVNPDSSYIQIPQSCKGFLVRLSLSGASIAENLQLDYIIDLSNIKYKVDSIFSTENGSVIVNEVLHFESIDYNDYPKVVFDSRIKEFPLNKKEIFELYF